VLLKEIIGVPCENLKKIEYILRAKYRSLNITDGGTYNCHWALADFIFFKEVEVWGLVQHRQSS
jgi:hypothetical protein